MLWVLAHILNPVRLRVFVPVEATRGVYTAEQLGCVGLHLVVGEGDVANCVQMLTAQRLHNEFDAGEVGPISQQIMRCLKSSAHR